MKHCAWQDWTHSQHVRGAVLTRPGLPLPETARGEADRGGGLSPPNRCAQRRKRAEEGVGLARLDPRTALQGGAA